MISLQSLIFFSGEIFFLFILCVLSKEVEVQHEVQKRVDLIHVPMFGVPPRNPDHLLNDNDSQVFVFVLCFFFLFG